MKLATILLGIIDIAIVVAILILIGLLIAWFMSWMGLPVPEQIRKVYMIIVALIGLYMLVALLLGMPSVRVLGFRAPAVTGPAVAALSTRAAADPARRTAVKALSGLTGL
jgi:hypothetical protein